MAWKDKLQEASFRNVPFKVDTDELTVGRKTAVHEFPQRDINYIEDLGRATREFSIEAYLVGDNYMDERDALIRALETPGEGQLVHPYYGLKKVQLSSIAKITQSKRDGGFCTVSVVFSETQIPQYPKEKIDSKTNLEAAAKICNESILSRFKKLFSIFQKAQAIVDRVSARINNALIEIQTAKSYGAKSLNFQNSAQKLKQNILAVALFPEDLAQTFIDLMNDDLSIFGIREDLKMKDYGADEYVVEQNELAFTEMIRQVSVVAAVQSVIGVDFSNSTEAASIRTDLIAALDALMDDAPDELYASLHALQGALNVDITTRSLNLPSIIIANLPAPTPSLFAAYDLYEDIDRADEISSKNGVIHPGFIPSDINLEVMTRE